jgi:ABC-type uncharacterized transport system substrate-binding protein
MVVYGSQVVLVWLQTTQPVQRITTIELVINTKTVTALGLTIPLAVLGLADVVIK